MKKTFRLLRYDWPLHFVLLFTNWLPDNTPCLALRGWLAHFFFGSCGRNLRLGRNVVFYNPRKIHLGSHIYAAYGCWFMGGAEIMIEDDAIFGPYCVIVSSNHQNGQGSFRYGIPKVAPIRVGRGSWVGAHVTITAGAEIGAGCLVAAGAVVTGKTYRPRHLVGGVPAREIRPLQNEPEI